MRARDWYFQGWERREDETGKKILVYTGEYYELPEGKAKLITGVMTGALACVYLSAALFPSEGGMWHIAAIPQLVEMIPLIYLVLGFLCLCAAKQPMTFRAYYSSWRRMKTASVWSAAFTAGMCIVEIVYPFIAESPALLPELWFLARLAACLALSVGLVFYFRSHTCPQIVKQ